MKFTGADVGIGKTVEFTMVEKVGAADEGIAVT